MTLRICIVGTGAIGGLLAARLSQTDSEVSCVARGLTRDAILDRGLKLVVGQKEITARIACSDDPAALGPQDFVLLTVKAQSVPGIVSSLPPLMKDTTTVVTLQNGLPWWFFQSWKGPYNGLNLKSVDPTGSLATSIQNDRILGGVIYPAALVVEPGLIRHVRGDRLALGEPSGNLTPRLATLTRVMQEAGLAAESVENIRSEICLKWTSNAAVNPVSVLTGATMDGMTGNPAVKQLLFDVMGEIAALCEKLSCPIPVPIKDILAGVQKMGAHKSSMLQDFEQGRALEAGPLLGAVQELAERLDVPTPKFDAIYSLLQLKLDQG